MIVTPDNKLFVEHDDARLQETGTGFGTRFFKHLEKQYRAQGVEAVIRACGDSVGRYEGARNGFDFAEEHERELFIRAFSEFLQEKGIEQVSFREEIIPVSALADSLHTPQDFLQVTIPDEITIWRAERGIDKTTGETVAINEREETYPGAKLGKAFFLDQGSRAKRSLDKSNFYKGMWSGIKRL